MKLSEKKCLFAVNDKEYLLSSKACKKIKNKDIIGEIETTRK